MLELLDLFKKEYEIAGDSYIFDNTRLQTGMFIKVNDDLSIDENEIIFVKDGKKKREEYPMELYDWYLEKEFYSRIYSKLGVYAPNRAIIAKDKKIHSINPYTLFLKRNSLPDKLNEFEACLNRHFDGMERLYDELEVSIDYSQYKSNFIVLSKKIIELSEIYNPGKDFALKIFFNKENKELIPFFEEYFRKKVFLNKVKKLNVVVDGIEKSPLSFENNLNSKKPYLQMKTMELGAPYISSYDEAMMFYKMSFVMRLLMKEFKDEIYLELDSNSIGNYEIINNKKYIKEYQSLEVLTIENPLDIIENPHKSMVDRDFIEKKLNRLFKGLLYELYYKDARDFHKNKKKFSDINILNKMIMDSETFKSYFKKNYDVSLFNIVNNLTLQIFDYEVKNNDISKLDMVKHREFWDLRMSLLNYFSERSRYNHMPKLMKEIITNTKEQLANTEDFFEIKNDEMFYFLSGQVAGFLVSLTEANKKTGRLFAPFLDASSVSKIKELIMYNYKNYGHKVSAYSNASINIVIQAINLYEVETPIKDKEMKNIFNAGLIGQNVFYMKNEKNNEGENDNE